MPKFSIIIPVYNVEKYLKKCLDSIANQTYSDFEAICIYDSSSDNSLNILKEYAQKDSRFKYYIGDNKGVGVARNYALELATGSYIGFVDSDDWVELNWLQEVADKISKTNADLIEFNNYENFESDGREKIHKDKIHLNSNKVFNFKINKKYLFGNHLAAWNKFVKKELIQNNYIKFSEYKRLEDLIFSVKIKVFAEKIAFINKPLYHYLTRKNSSVNSLSVKNIQVINCCIETKDFLKEQKLFDNYKNEFYNNALQTFHHAYISLPENLKSEFVNKTEDFFESKKYSKAVINGKKTFLKQLFSVVNIYEFGQKMGKQITILGIKFNISSKKEKY